MRYVVKRIDNLDKMQPNASPLPRSLTIVRASAELIARA
jgi:hypothetical protein